MKFTRLWAMPSADTCDIQPIGELVKRYLRQSKVSIDPFARNKRWATYTNDLNPDTAAEYHKDAFEFLCMLLQQGVTADLVIFDPPYSREQVKQVYQGVGRHYGQADSQEHSTNWRKERDLVNDLLEVGGVVISFGWNTAGMGKERLYQPEELLIVPHGGAHNDTLIFVERKLAYQTRMF